MKKLVCLLIAFLTPALAEAQAAASPANVQAPQATALQEIFAVDLEGLEAVLAPLPDSKAGGPTPAWCTNRTNNYCTYAWNWMTRCCYATYISPGAYCPMICE